MTQKQNEKPEQSKCEHGHRYIDSASCPDCIKVNFEGNIGLHDYSGLDVNYIENKILKQRCKELEIEIEALKAELQNKDAVRLWNENEELKAKLEIAVEALQQIDSEWCRHDIDRDYLTRSRQWCSSCQNWIYENVNNPARDALEKIGEVK